ncbi:hypothetical protein SUGI_0443460 [Cryptomeria japonica]|uniref:TMV resistance protein N isoform X2 n=1 Tax=Cryptomeria japonica TaxID=3369 RepID=UPI002408BE6B|nr:TMV resistance protein N isoform X2 [Cryptomeria japonica]XP_057813498.1 TMV resistance protein N isoform X2 [Cryptomeria japonica]GLJ23430.1 hypothetical protein SUGI_0443460 [Cryptomeria japonica]
MENLNQKLITSSLRRNVGKEGEKPSSNYLPKHVFLSHSGQQKDFVEQLFVDMEKLNISCFFDKDNKSLPKGENFPSLIFKAAEKCKIAVIVLSEDFITTKWPMLELCAFVKAKSEKNPSLKIFPLFFKMTPKELSEFIHSIENKRYPDSWNQLYKSDDRINLEAWLDALKALRSINGEIYIKEEGEVAYRRRIISRIRPLLPQSLKYEDISIKGKERLCLEIHLLFLSVPCSKTGARVVGLYGIGGCGKTTLGMSLCNFYWEIFEGRVFHAELQRNDPTKNIKRALKYLTDADEQSLDSVENAQQGWHMFRERMPYYKGFLVVDNIGDERESIDEARNLLDAGFGEGSMILLTARSPNILKSVIPEIENSIVPVPALNEDEAIAVLMDLPLEKVFELSSEQKHNARKCAQSCLFRRQGWEEGNYNNPLALKTYGAYLRDKFTCDSSKWVQIPEFSQYSVKYEAHQNIFAIFELSFNGLYRRHLKIFMLLNLYLPQSRNYRDYKSFDEIRKWLALVCCNENENEESIREAMYDLKKKGLIEECEPEIYIHDLLKEFAEIKANKVEEWISLEKVNEIPVTQSAIEAMKFIDCKMKILGTVNDDSYRFLCVLHLENMSKLKILDLGSMKSVRSIRIESCHKLKEIQGVQNLSTLRYFDLINCCREVKCSGISNLRGLRHLYAHLKKGDLDCSTHVECHDLSKCYSLEDIFVRRGSQVKLPKLKHLHHLQTLKVEHCDDLIGPENFNVCLELKSIKLWVCENVTGLLNFSGCTKLENITIQECLFKTPGPLNFAGCTKLENITIKECSTKMPGPLNLTGCYNVQTMDVNAENWLTEIQGLDGMTNLIYLSIGDMENVEEFPSFKQLHNLTCFSLVNCSIREPPDLTNCFKLMTVSIIGCKNLGRSPILYGLPALKSLSLVGCTGVTDPPDVSWCTDLELLDVRDNENMEGVPCMIDCVSLKWVFLTWHVKRADGTKILWKFNNVKFFYDPSVECPHYEDHWVGVPDIPQQLKESPIFFNFRRPHSEVFLIDGRPYSVCLI